MKQYAKSEKHRMGHYQKGDIVTIMLIMMVVMIVLMVVNRTGHGPMGMWHGGDHAEHTHAAPSDTPSVNKGDAEGKQPSTNSEPQK